MLAERVKGGMLHIILRILVSCHYLQVGEYKAGKAKVLSYLIRVVSQSCNYRISHDILSERLNNLIHHPPN
jgi:hypothetical protein